MWRSRSHKLATLTKLTPNKRKFKWTKIEQYAFGEINRTLDRDNLLTYPDFNEAFKTHTNSSNLQFGAIIIQKGKPIVFNSRKLPDA